MIKFQKKNSWAPLTYYHLTERFKIMDCHASARGSIPGGNDLFTELHILRKCRLSMTSLLKGRKTQTNYIK